MTENTSGTVERSTTSAALSSDNSYRFAFPLSCRIYLILIHSCREYLDIDLTGEPSGSADSDSETDELPLPPVAIRRLPTTAP
jgi:hypothetical protein